MPGSGPYRLVEESPTKVNIKPFRRMQGLLFLSVMVAYVVLVAQGIFGSAVETIQDFIHSAGFSVYVFFCFFAINATVVMQPPGMAVTMFLSMFVGMLPGLLVVWIGSILGSIIVYYLGSDLARASVDGVLENYPYFKRLMVPVMASKGLPAVFFVRFSADMPTNVCNYAAVHIPLPAPVYLAVAAFCYLPRLLFFAALGTFLNDVILIAAKATTPTTSLYLLMAGLFLYAAAYIALCRFSTTKLRKWCVHYAAQLDIQDEVPDVFAAQLEGDGPLSPRMSPRMSRLDSSVPRVDGSDPHLSLVVHSED